MEKNSRQFRVLLVRPYFEMQKNELGFLPFEPLGLQYIHSALCAQGHKVELYDCLAEHPEKIKLLEKENIFRCGSSDEDIIKEIKKFKPQVVAISGMFFSQAKPFFQIAALVKQIFPDILVVGGGNFPSFYQEQILADNNFDFIISGEADESFPELLQNLDNPSTVRGAAYRDKNGKVVLNEARPIKMNINDLPLPYRDFSKIYNYAKHVGYNWNGTFNLKKAIKRFVYYQSLSYPFLRNCFAAAFNYLHQDKPKALFIPHACISTSRGCPNRCTFCAVHKFYGGLYRMRSARSVLAEIDLLIKKGVREIIIIDDNFTVSKSRTIEICREIIDRRYNLRLSMPSGLYIPSLDREVLECLFKAGLKHLSFAVENGDQAFLDTVIRKKLDLRQAGEIIRQAGEIGFHTTGFFIFGYPGETKEIMLKTLRFAFECGLHSSRFFIFQPFPGTEAYQMAKDEGAIEKDLDFSKLKVMTDLPQISTKDFSKEDVKNIHDLANKIQKEGNYEQIKDKIPNILGWGQMSLS
jgi:radical SAM superfamily enzyme YgiQ (UPF0313 family)